MNTGTQSGYIFHGNNIYRQHISTTRVGFAKEALKHLSDINGITVCKPFEGVDFFSVSKLNNDTYSHYSTELKEIALNTYFLPYSGAVFGDQDNWPAMKASFRNTDDSIKKTINWTPPEYMKLFFVSSFLELSEEPVINYLLCKIDDELYRPPFPNVYDDSRVCMGYDFEDKWQSDTKIERHQKAYNFFQETNWNEDLLSDQCQFLLFNSEDKPFHPTKETYQSHLNIISLNRLSWAVDL